MGRIQIRSWGNRKSHGTGAVGRGLGLIAIATVIVATLAPAASAALEPGVPIAVAPGVPGHGRAWELVTSANPDSAVLRGTSALSASGNDLFYTALGPIAGATTGDPLYSQNFARRSPEGWLNASTTVPLPLERFDSHSIAPIAFDPLFEGSIWSTPLLENAGQGLFRRTPDGVYTSIAELGIAGVAMGVSPDLQHLVFTSDKHLLPADASRISGTSVYELVGSALRLVDVDDDGAPLSSCGSVPGVGRTVSVDMRRIFFLSIDCNGLTHAYLSEDGAAATEISAPQCDLSCGPEASIRLVGSTPSGSRAFLGTEERLTDADSNTHFDFYRYDVASGELTLITSAPGALDLTPSAETSVGISEDGSRLYFGAIENPPGDPGEAGKLYLADDSGVRPIPGAKANDFFQASQNGRYLLYMARAAGENGDTDASYDIYRYDAETGSARRISTGPSGGNGPFDAYISLGFSGRIVNQGLLMMSDDGGRAFFTTDERLLPQDRNEVADVYEWAGGELGLISSGAAGAGGSAFMGTNGDGGTVLFSSTATLLPRDRDGGDLDYYAARIGGGFAEAPPSAGCSGASCSSSPGGRVARRAPATVGGLGNKIKLGRIDPAALRRAAATGRIPLLAEVPRRGRLLAEARAAVGGRMRTIAAAEIAVSQPGPVRLWVRLSRQSREALARGKDLHVRLQLRLSGLDSVGRGAFELRGRR